MKKPLGIGIAASICTAIILLAMVYHSYSQISITLEEVSLHSIDWADISFSLLVEIGLKILGGDLLNAAFGLVEGINLNLLFGITNNGLVPVYLPDLSYDLIINGIKIGEGKTTIQDTIYPGQTKRVQSFQNFKKSGLLPAIDSIVEKNGTMEIRVKGIGQLQFLGQSIPIPFEASKEVSVYDEIRQKLLAEIGR